MEETRAPDLEHAPPGIVPSEEMVEPPFVEEAAVKGILAIAARG